MYAINIKSTRGLLKVLMRLATICFINGYVFIRCMYRLLRNDLISIWRMRKALHLCCTCAVWRMCMEYGRCWEGMGLNLLMCCTKGDLRHSPVWTTPKTGIAIHCIALIHMLVCLLLITYTVHHARQLSDMVQLLEVAIASSTD